MFTCYDEAINVFELASQTHLCLWNQWEWSGWPPLYTARRSSGQGFKKFSNIRRPRERSNFYSILDFKTAIYKIQDAFNLNLLSNALVTSNKKSVKWYNVLLRHWNFCADFDHINCCRVPNWPFWLSLYTENGTSFSRMKEELVAFLRIVIINHRYYNLKESLTLLLKLVGS